MQTRNFEPKVGFEPTRDFSAALQVQCNRPLYDSGILAAHTGFEPVP